VRPEGFPSRLVIVGGGTAGWLTAAYLDRAFNRDGARPLGITLVESAAIGRVGVGEATIPTLKRTLDFLGIRERDFLRRTKATLKHAIRFEDWARPGHVYYHPFEALETKVGIDPAPGWLMRRAAGSTVPFHVEAGIQSVVADAGRSPRRVEDAQDYLGRLPYAYHTNAEALGDMLCETACGRGVRRIVDEVVSVVQTEDGDIAALNTRNNGCIEGDFFDDCTGFASLLIGKVLKTPYQPFGQNLLCDRAVAIPSPYREPPANIAPYTTCTALSAGWMWKIGLQDRLGLGYVYSSAFTTPDQAERELRQKAGLDESLGARHLQMRVGRHAASWVRNCAAIGLSAGFIEPLESTGIYLVELAAAKLAAYFPLSGYNEGAVALFNAEMGEAYDSIRDFVVAHYCLTRRADTEFWREVQRRERIPDSLAQLLELWRDLPPMAAHIPARAFFGHANYQFILYGMDWTPPEVMRNAPRWGKGNEDVDRIRQAAARALADLPQHSEWLASLN
jgi:tryptophan halogenase